MIQSAKTIARLSLGGLRLAAATCELKSSSSSLCSDRRQSLRHARTRKAGNKREWRHIGRAARVENAACLADGSARPAESQGTIMNSHKYGGKCEKDEINVRGN